NLVRPVGTYLYGRRMYETMAVWETMNTPDHAPVTRDFAEIWQAANKVVYSRTLKTVSSPRTRIEPEFNPDDVRRMKELADRDIAVGGAELASQAIKAGLVDEYHVIVSPIVIGGGKRSLPGGIRVMLDLRTERCFAGGIVHLHYRTRSG